MRVVLKVRVFWLYSGDHFRWFKGLAKVLQKKTPQDYTFSQQMRDSITEYIKMQERHPQKGFLISGHSCTKA